MKKVLILILLLFCSYVIAEDVDFTNMTLLECTSQLAIHNVTGGSTTYRDFVEHFFIDSTNNQIYTESKKLVTNLTEFNDKTIKFELNNNVDNRQYNRKYEIDRYTGRIYSNETVRHNIGVVGWLTYAALDISGKGTCIPMEKGKKF